MFATVMAQASFAEAQTVADLARRGQCSTAGLEGISRQLAEAQMCLRPGQFVRFAPHPNITLTSSRVHPYLQASARDALWSAAASGEIRVTSAFRTLADQFVLYESGGCGLAARPGRSNHQSGRAVDVSNHSSRRGALQSAGCSWLGSRDPVHFDCAGTDRRSDAVLAFQRLWNVNHPSDRIAEDGSYGPETDARMRRTPAGGFSNGACDCTPGCDGTVVLGADCSRRDCADSGSTCSLGLGEPICVSEYCVSSPSERPEIHSVCLPDGTIADCDGRGNLREPRACPAETRCIEGRGTAACSGGISGPGTPSSDGSVPDGSVSDGGTREGGAPEGGAGGFVPPNRVGGMEDSRGTLSGCEAVPIEEAGGWMLLIALALRRRR